MPGMWHECSCRCITFHVNFLCSFMHWASYIKSILHAYDQHNVFPCAHIYIYIIYIILLYLYNLIIYILYIYSAHPCKDILKINNMYNIFTIHTYDKRCISLRSLYIKNVSHNWLISIGSMVIQGSLNIYDVSQIWYTPMWWYVSFLVL
jgi:hypothetical protein